MPNGSPWPILLALCVSGLFAVLTIEKYSVAIVFGVFRAADAPRLALAGAGGGMSTVDVIARARPPRPVGGRARHGDVRRHRGDAVRDA